MAARYAMNICYNCFKPCHFVCERCGDAEYCGRGCQIEHWKKTHRHFCRRRRAVAADATQCRPVRSAIYLARPLRTCGSVIGEDSKTCGAPLTQEDYPICIHADPSLRWGASRQLPLARTPMRLSDYELMGKMKLLGEGSSGGVSRGIRVQSYGRPAGPVALKVIKTDADMPTEISFTMVHEVEMRNFAHPNIAGICDAGFLVDDPDGDRGTLAIAMDVASSALDDFVSDEQIARVSESGKAMSPLSSADTAFVVYQMLKGIAWAHVNLVLHLDIKPGNFLVYGKKVARGVVEPVLKLADFGLSRGFCVGVVKSMYTYTLGYRPPENARSEAWAMGSAAFEVATGHHAFYGADDAEHLVDMVGQLGVPPTDVRAKHYPDWDSKITFLPAKVVASGKSFDSTLGNDMKELDHDPGLIKLIGRMLSWNPDERPTVFEALRDRCFVSTGAVARWKAACGNDFDTLPAYEEQKLLESATRFHLRFTRAGRPIPEWALAVFRHREDIYYGTPKQKQTQSKGEDEKDAFYQKFTKLNAASMLEDGLTNKHSPATIFAGISLLHRFILTRPALAQISGQDNRAQYTNAACLRLALKYREGLDMGLHWATPDLGIQCDVEREVFRALDFDMSVPSIADFVGQLAVVYGDDSMDSKILSDAALRVAAAYVSEVPAAYLERPSVIAALACAYVQDNVEGRGESMSLPEAPIPVIPLLQKRQLDAVVTAHLESQRSRIAKLWDEMDSSAAANVLRGVLTP